MAISSEFHMVTARPGYFGAENPEPKRGMSSLDEEQPWRIGMLFLAHFLFLFDFWRGVMQMEIKKGLLILEPGY